MHRNRGFLILSLASTLGIGACSSNSPSATGDRGTGGAESAGASANGGSGAAGAGTTGAQGGITATGSGGANVGTNPIRNPSFEIPSANGSPWISGADQWIASGNATRIANLPSMATNGSASMRIGAGQNSNNSLCDASFSYVAQDNVDLSHFGSLTFDWTVVGSMTYTASPADIVFRVGLQNTGDLWTMTFSPPTSSGIADLNQHGTETITIPKGTSLGEFSVDVQYIGAIGVTEAQCVIAYVDNFQVK